MKKSFYLIIVILVWSVSVFGQQGKAVHVAVDFSKKVGDMNPMWAWFGYDEPNYTYMKDGKKLLTELAALSPTPVFVRAHSLLVTGDGKAALKWGSTNAYTEDASGKPIYDWKIIDSIFDNYIKRGMKPLAQIGFMPEALSTHPTPYRHNWKPGDPYGDIMTGWAYPPKDYDKWGELIYQWVKHSVARYGEQEVESWYWEVWNEPNYYWKGTMEEFFKLYDYSANAVKRALPTAKIGGLDIAGTRSDGAKKWMNAFLKHCLSGTNYATGKVGSPIDIFLFHAKGEPKLINGVVRMDMSTQLRDIATGFKTLANYPELKHLPIVIGESDPEGCAACGMATNPQNAYRNGTMYSSYTAASFARKYLLADQYGINFLGAVSWSFEFEDQPWFYGFRDLATNGVDKPVLNVFRMFGKMSGQRVAVSSARMKPLQTVLDSSIRGDQPEIGLLASIDEKTAGIMVWSYHDLDQQNTKENLFVKLEGLPNKKVKVTSYMIDSKHSNSFEVWKRMGSPQKPTTAQIATLEKAGQLAMLGQPKTFKVKDGKLTLRTHLERQAVGFMKLEWEIGDRK